MNVSILLSSFIFLSPFIGTNSHDLTDQFPTPNSSIMSLSTQETHLSIAKKYFEAFHEGRIEEVLTYFHKDGIVKYGAQAPQNAKDFFHQTKELIASISFKTHGMYNSKETNIVLIHFSFTMPGEKKPTEAVDIIEFGENNLIKEVRVISNN